MLPRPILVTGAYRSGTTWVGRMLASHPEVVYVEEPLNLRDDGPALYNFQDIAATDPEPFLSYIRAQIASVSPQRALLKDPMALMAAEWLADTFDMDVVVLIRHPAAFAGSIKVLDWFHPWDHFVKQPELLAGRLEAFAPEIQALSRKRGDVVEDAKLVWRVCHRVIRQYQIERPRWTFVRHEDLSHQPIDGFARLFQAVGLPFTETCRQVVVEHSSNVQDLADRTAEGHPYDVRRNSAHNLSLWRTRLTPEELDRLRPGLEDFEHFYPEAEWKF